MLYVLHGNYRYIYMDQFSYSILTYDHMVIARLYDNTLILYILLCVLCIYNI